MGTSGKNKILSKCLSDVQCKRYSGENSGSHYFEFQDYDDEIINYSLWITFDENGFVIDVSDIDAQGFEGEDCRQSYTDGCSPDYGFLESEISRELAEDE